MKSTTFEAPSRQTVRDLVQHHARVVLGEGGAIDSCDGRGFTLTKVAEQTGRYLIQAVDSAGDECALAGLRDVQVSIIAASIANGEASTWRVTDISEDGGTVTVQFAAVTVTTTDGVNAVTHVDAELPDDASFDLAFSSIRREDTP